MGTMTRRALLQTLAGQALAVGAAHGQTEQYKQGALDVLKSAYRAGWNGDMQQTLDRIGIHRFSIAGTASRKFQWWAIIATSFAALISAPAQADQWSLLINGKAIHLENPAGTDFNEDNWGAGLQYGFL